MLLGEDMQMEDFSKKTWGSGDYTESSFKIILPLTMR